MEEHQPIGIDYQLIRDNNYLEDSITQHYMKFNEERRGESSFWDYTFPQAEFAYNMVRNSKDVQEEVQLKIKKINKKCKATAIKNRREEHFEKEEMMMVLLRRKKISTERVPTKPKSRLELEDKFF